MRVTEKHQEGLVHNATYLVRCGCGFAHDSNAVSGAQAMIDMLKVHVHDGAQLRFEKIDPQSHPHHQKCADGTCTHQEARA